MPWIPCSLKIVFNNFLFCFHTSTVYWPMFKFTEAFLGCVRSTDEPVRVMLHLCYCGEGTFISSMPFAICLLFPFLCWNDPSIHECLSTGACNILIIVILNPLSVCFVSQQQIIFPFHFICLITFHWNVHALCRVAETKVDSVYVWK